jgi:hypothetical protein
MDIVAAGEGFRRRRAMVLNATRQIAGHANVERAAFSACEDACAEA